MARRMVKETRVETGLERLPYRESTGSTKLHNPWSIPTQDTTRTYARTQRRTHACMHKLDLDIQQFVARLLRFFDL